MRHSSIPGTCVVMLCLLLPGNVSAIDSKADSLVNVVLEQAFREKYDEALRTAETMIELDPESELGYLTAAGVRLGIMQLYRTRRFENEFKDLIDLAIKKGEKRVKDGDAWDYFFLGGAYGFRGSQKARELNWVGAFTDGWKGLQALHRSLMYDPTLYDAQLGFGLYHYWRSAMAGVLRSLPFVGDDRQKGIEEIRLAIDQGRYTYVIGNFALAEVYFNEKEFPAADSLNRILIDAYPSNIAWLYMKLRLEDATKHWSASVKSSQRIIDRLNESPYRTEGFLSEAYWLMAKAYVELDQPDAARKACERGLQIAEERDASEELEGPWESFSEIHKNLKEIRKDLETS